MLTEDLSLYFADFGVAVTSGAVTGKGILDMPSQVIVNGSVLSTEYSVVVLTSEFGGLLYGAPITVDGISYSVREAMLITDGLFTEISLQRLAPTSSAPGQNPNTFGLSDLTDVDTAGASAGDALKYDGTQWVDAPDEGTAFVYTQSTAASTWTVNHNLGYVPTVRIFDSGSQEIEAAVSHPSTNTAVIVFLLPVAGFARLI